MKPVYQFPIPPLKPLSMPISKLSNTSSERGESANEPLPKRIRLEPEEIPQHSNALEHLLEQFNAQHPRASAVDDA